MLCHVVIFAGDGKPSAAKDGKGKGKQQQQEGSWLVRKYKAARHAARGIFNRTLRVRPGHALARYISYI
jgi:hypothetical protein